MGFHHAGDVPRHGRRTPARRRDLVRRAVGEVAPQPFDFGRDALAFGFQELGNRVTEAPVRNEVRAPGDYRLVAARNLVLALRAGLNASEAMVDRPFDRLVIAEFEVEEWHFLGAAPVAAVERVRADEIQRAGDRLRTTAGEEEQHRLAEPLSDEVEELPREVGIAPLPRAGVLVERPHRVPFGGSDLASTKRPECELVASGCSLFAQRL